MKEKYEESHAQIKETFYRKNADYGNSFEESLDEFGLVAAVVRMDDKMRRIKNLTKREAMVDEKIEDTLLDLANYAIMATAWMKKKVPVDEFRKMNNQ